MRGGWGQLRYVTTERGQGIAPSWSWASVHGDMRHYLKSDKTKFEPLIKLQRIDTDLEPPEFNPLGRVGGSILVVKGRTIKLDLDRKGEFTSLHYRDGGLGLILNDCTITCSGSFAHKTTKTDAIVPFKYKVELLIAGYSQHYSSTKKKDMFTFYGQVLGRDRCDNEVYTRLGIQTFEMNDSLGSTWMKGGI